MMFVLITLMYHLAYVPQGSHLSTLLFNFFINSISNYVSRMKVLFYADDVKIIHKIKILEDYSLLQDELNIFSDWVVHLYFSLNLRKCHAISPSPDFAHLFTTIILLMALFLTVFSFMLCPR